MDELSINNLTKQREFFDNGATLDLEFRLNQLKKLREAIIAGKEDLLGALVKDLAKPRLEAYSSEIQPLLDELDHVISSLKSWIKPYRVATPLKLFRSKSYIAMQPLGCVLIVAPWNYPVQLLLSPLIGALAAGNCAVVKPSELTPLVSEVLSRLIRECFAREYVFAVTGEGVQTVPFLIEKGSFNHVFFTGSPKVGSLIAVECARRLIPYTLELGGKSPVVVDKSADLSITAKRIIWSKFFNAGQTCIAPDYVVADSEIYPRLVNELCRVIQEFKLDKLGNMSKIVSQAHFSRLTAYLAMGEVVCGGDYNETKLQLNATLITKLQPESPLLQEEIFGPILPVITYDSNDELFKIIRNNRYPLTCYIYSRNKKFSDYIMQKVEAGSFGVNIGLYQFANHHLPFGGVMGSGQGRYHGKYSFERFSNPVSIIDNALFPDLPLKYPPYLCVKEWLLRKF